MMEKAAAKGWKRALAARDVVVVLRWFKFCTNLPEQAWRLKRLVRVRKSLIRKREIKYVGNE